MEEMRSIIEDLQRFVVDHEGGDYLQVYEADDGPVLWSGASISSPSGCERVKFTAEQLAEYDYWTMLLP